MIKSALLSLLLVAASAIDGAAQERSARMPEWRAAISTGSQRLLLFSLLKTQPRGSLTFQKTLADRLGFFHKPSDGLTMGKPRVNVAPILEYDENVNGGVPGGSFSLGGYEFDVGQGSRAKAAMVLGARISTRLPIVYDEGSTLELGLSGTLRHAPAEDVTRSAIRLSACADEYLSHWSWLTLCAGYKYDDARDIDTTEEGRFGSVGLRKIFSSSIGSHEGTITLTQDQLADYGKLSASGTLTSAITGLGALNLAATWGEKVQGENTLTRGISVSLARPVFDKPARLALGYYKTDGANFFGTGRQDRTYTLSIGREMAGVLWVGVGLRRRDSTVDIYDENELTLDASFLGWTF